MYDFKRYLTFLAILVLVGWGCKNNQAPQTAGKSIDFNRDWQFVRDVDTTITSNLFEKDAAQLAWESVQLPHTAHIEPLVIRDQQWQGTAFYRKFFTVDESRKGKKLALKFGAAMNEADIYLNGQHLVKHKGGYLPFVVDLTGRVKYGEENVLLVKLNNEDNPHIPPGKPIDDLDFNYFGGLYRGVKLQVNDKLHISDPIQADRVAGGGVMVAYDEVSESSALVNIKTDIRNDYDSTLNARIDFVLQDPTGKVVKSAETDSRVVSAGAYSTFEHQLEVNKPVLWSPEHPNLYTLTVQLFKNEELVDSWQKRIGIRAIGFNDQNQFMLNGKRVFLRGTNRHQSYPYIGYALSDNAQYRDARKIKEAGFNFIRSAHYPPAPAFLEACDELGIMIMDPTPGWQFFGGKEFRELSFQNIREMIRRDRNHPSVIMWEASLNESGMSESFMDSANAIVDEELPGRPAIASGWMDYAYDVFIPARQHAKPPEYWNDYDKDKPLFIAEYGDWEYYAQNAGFNQKAFKDLKKEARSSRQRRGDGQKRLAQQALNFQEAHNSNLRGPAFGDANWVMYDYNRGYAPNLEASGIMDIFRIPKFSYYFYKSQAGPSLDEKAEFDTPMIYIANYWSDPEFRELKIYSNTEKVALYLNGNLVGSSRPDSGRVSSDLKHPPFTFNLDKFEPGHLRAVGYTNGHPVVEASRITPGDAEAIKLDVDLSGKPLEAGQKDVVFVYASVVDNDGTVVHDAKNDISFSVEGNAKLVGDNPIAAEAGIATILLRAGNEPGTVKIHAKADGLKTAIKEVEVGIRN